MRKLMIAGLIGTVGLYGALTATPATAADIVLKAGHTQNAGEPMDRALKIMSEHLEKATNGKATIQIFPSMQLGGEVEMIKQVMTGTLDIVTPSNAPLTNFVPELKIFDMPFLFRDEAHMIKVLRGPVLQDISNIVAKRGIRLLGVFNIGVRHIMSKKPVKSIADLKGPEDPDHAEQVSHGGLQRLRRKCNADQLRRALLVPPDRRRGRRRGG